MIYIYTILHVLIYVYALFSISVIRKEKENYRILKSKVRKYKDNPNLVYDKYAALRNYNASLATITLGAMFLISDFVKIIMYLVGK